MGLKLLAGQSEATDALSYLQVDPILSRPNTRLRITIGINRKASVVSSWREQGSELW